MDLAQIPLLRILQVEHVALVLPMFSQICRSPPPTEAGGDAEPHSQDTGTKFTHFRHFSKADKIRRERLFAESNPRQRPHSRKVLSHCLS